MNIKKTLAAVIGIYLLFIAVLGVSIYAIFRAGSEKQYASNFEKPAELASPKERISKNQIQVLDDGIIIQLEKGKLATFADTNSMDPVIDSATKSIQIKPKSEKEISIGDIIAYKPAYSNSIITHRVIETGYDSKGWYAVAKGDNNDASDPGVIRFDQVVGIVVVLIQ